MFSLIKKDFLLQRRTFIVGIIYSIFLFSALGKGKYMGPSIYPMISVAIALLLLMGANAHDDKNNSYALLINLPIKRFQIVLTKYSSLLAFIATGLIFSLVVGTSLKVLGISHVAGYMNISDIVYAVIGFGLLSSVYLPLHFRFGGQAMKYVGIIMFIIAFSVPSFIYKDILNSNVSIIKDLVNYISTSPPWLINLMGLGLILVILGISYKVSVEIFNRKEY